MNSVSACVMFVFRFLRFVHVMTHFIFPYAYYTVTRSSRNSNSDKNGVSLDSSDTSVFTSSNSAITVQQGTTMLKHEKEEEYYEG